MIRQELILILLMVSGGMAIMLFYDLLIVIRVIIKPTPVWTALEDILYWSVAAVCTFYTIYRVNEGIIRGYAVAGLVAGAILFQWSIGSRMVGFLTNCINNIRKCLINLFYRCKMIIKWHDRNG